jgi:hypothetical protein
MNMIEFFNYSILFNFYLYIYFIYENYLKYSKQKILIFKKNIKI